MKIRLSLMLLLTLPGLAQPAVAADAAAASPYQQQRNQAYTSFDNPYAPGAIYNPYGHRKSGIQSATTGGSASLSAQSHRGISSSAAPDDLGEGTSSCSGSLNGSPAGSYSGSAAGSGSRSRKYSTGAGLGHCGVNAGYGRGPANGKRLDGTNRLNGLNNGLGMNNVQGRSPQTQLQKRLQKTQQ